MISGIELARARAIAQMGESEGWRHFVEVANALMLTMTPNVSTFDTQQATVIASQMAFVSGVKRCLELMDQQKDAIKDLKE